MRPKNWLLQDTGRFSSGVRDLRGLGYLATGEVRATFRASLGADTLEVSIALRTALSLEGVECRPK